jgi:hypothetical protein
VVTLPKAKRDDDVEEKEKGVADDRKRQKRVVITRTNLWT